MAGTMTTGSFAKDLKPGVSNIAPHCGNVMSKLIELRESRNVKTTATLS